MWLKNNRNLILMVLEPGKSKIKALAYLVSDEGHFHPFPGSQMVVFSLGLHVVGGAMEFPEVSYKGTNSFHECPTLVT